jgi:hypothetical protein
MQHGKKRIAVLLDLRTLMTLARIFDVKLVQAEFLRHLVELVDRRLEQRNPDEDLRTMHVLADVGDRDVCDLAAFLVCDAADEHEARRGELTPS